MKLKLNSLLNNRSIGYLVNIIGILILGMTIIRLLTVVGNFSAISVVNSGYNEIRDYVSFRLAHLFLMRENPYTFDNLTELNVPFMCLYTPLYPGLVAIACKLTGYSIVAGYYIVNIVLFILTAFNMWLILKEFFDNSRLVGVIVIAANVATFFSLFGLPILNFHSDTVGIFITSLIFLVLYKDRRKTWILAILTVSLIFTKQILLVMAAPLFIYYLIVDRKLALKYMLQCIVCGLVTVAVVQILFPLYWTETIYMQFAVSESTGTLNHALKNIGECYSRYLPYFVLSLIGIVISVVVGFVKKDLYTFKTNAKSIIKDKAYLIYLVLNIVIGTLSLLYFARGYEDGYKYCQDILAPSFFLLCALIWNGYTVKRLESIELGSSTIKQGGAVIVLCCVTVTVCSHFSYRLYTKWDADTMVRLDSLLASYDGGTIYVGVNATPYMVNRNMWEPEANVYFNDGQIEYFLKEAPDLPINGLFYEEEVIDAANEYADRINGMVERREFDVIAISVENVIDMDILEDNYEEYKTFRVETATNICYPVTVWVPIED